MKLVNLITRSVPHVCYFNAGTVTQCPWVTDLHWVTSRGKREEEEGASSHTNACTCIHRHKAESDNAMWRKAVISEYRSYLLNHIELKGLNGLG